MSEKHICLIYTGGTVGMVRTAHGYAPMPDFAHVLCAALAGCGGALPRYTLHAYATPIDSSNATPDDWRRIAADVATRYDDYDGFVILHGTDTLAYTASALSFMLRGLRKPVIVTGAQIPLGEARSDALQNVVTSLQLAASEAIAEVAIYFNQRLLRGNRSTKVSAESFDAFDSPNYPRLGCAGIGLRLDSFTLLPRAEKEEFRLPPYDTGRILPIRFVPGLPVNAVQAMLALAPQALIFQCYGAGNAPDRDPALFDLVAKAAARGIVPVVCSQSPHGRVRLGAYATGASLARAGAVGALDMTFEAIFAKLHHLFALGLSPQAVKAELVRNLSGEVTEERTG
ncbi:MAG TPA: asparaginase domain-containing protein [Burkholderiaceae bacterium]|jgi:L-asparaginase|nr:asparaginase domain-containing protein [Burkholderiaceae bacterium]